MENNKIYMQAFVDAFEVDEDIVPGLEYESIEVWDSVGHMILMAALEEGFEIMLEMEDIIDFSGFEKGKELLSKYDIKF
jgi:acyl carrier protein